MAEFVENSRMKMITSANVSMATEGKTAKVKKQTNKKQVRQRNVGAD